MEDNATRMTATLQRWLPFHSVTYYNTLFQAAAGLLAIIWLFRSLFARGVVKTARTAAIKST